MPPLKTPSKSKSSKSPAGESLPSAPPAPSALPWADWPIQEIALDKIVEHGHTHRVPTIANVKQDPALQLLAKTMREDGLLQPILVYQNVEGDFARIFGSRRTAAANLNGARTIAARVRPGIPSDEEVHRLRALENFARAEPNPAERAITAVEMVNSFAGKVDRAGAIVRTAAALGMSETWVQDCLYIIERLSDKTQSRLAAGELNLGQARALAKVGDHALQEKFAKQIADDLAPPDSSFSANSGRGGRVTPVLQIEGWIADAKRSLKIIPWDPAAVMNTGVKGCAACVGCAFNTATDVDLFGTSKDEAESGCCTNPRGFEAKQAMTAKAIAAGEKKIQRQIDDKALTNEQAGSIDTIREAVPAFVKPSSAQRKIKSDLKLEKPGTKKAEKALAKEEAKKTDPHVEAMHKWWEAYRSWSRDANTKITKSVFKSPKKILCYLALQATDVWHSRPKMNGDGSQEMISPSLSKLLDLCAKGKPEAIAAAVTADSITVDDYGYGAEATEVMQRVAKAFGAKVDDAPAQPIKEVKSKK